jgi:hypothetical protein
MKRIEFLSTILVLLLSLFVGWADAKANQRRSDVGASIIRGRVLLTQSQRPARRVSVSLLRDINHAPLKLTVTNNRGEFHFDRVVAGTYLVVASGPGLKSSLQVFELSEFGMSQPSEDTSRASVTVDGRNQQSCELRVSRGGTIKGTITYHDREPVVGARVLLYRRKDDLIVPLFVQIGVEGESLGALFSETTTTDDRGGYRIDGLSDGIYFVGVSEGRTGGTRRGPHDGKSIVNAYYPGATNLKEARSIQVQNESVVENINFTLDDAGLRRMSGLVKWRESGQIVEGASVSIRRKNEPKVESSLGNVADNTYDPDSDSVERMMKLTTLMTLMTGDTTSTVSDSNGRWQFSDLPASTYVVSVIVPLSSRNKRSIERSEEALDVAGDFEPNTDRLIQRDVEVSLEESDAKDITLDLSVGGRVLGSVVGDADPDLAVRISVATGVKLPDILDLPYSSNPDGSFVLEGIPGGPVRIDVELSRHDPRYLKSITRDGKDLMREVLTVVDGVDSTGVRIELASGVAIMSGNVISRGDKSVAGNSGILLVPVDPSLWHLRALRVFTRAKTNGEYAIRCPPGEYLLFTWRAGNDPVQAIENFIRTNASTAQRVVVSKDEIKKMDLWVESQRR